MYLSSRYGQEIFFSCNFPGLAIAPSQPPSQWVFLLFPEGQVDGALGLSRSSNEIKYEWRYNSALPIRLLNVDRDDFAFSNLPSIVCSPDTL